VNQAPNFTLQDQTGQARSLSDYHGKWVVLYFYPADETPGCTAEACAFRDANESLLAQGAVVLGVSKDSVDSHAKFAAHHQLPFTLLSDPDHKVIEAYGAWGKGFMGKTGTLRQTVIIGPTGKIVKKYPKVTPAEHASQILQDLRALSAST
jgi:peroxiredoxin Q/BCP